MRSLTAFNQEKSSLANSGVSAIAKDMKLEDIKLKDEFVTLFPINPTNLELITERMKKNGFDKSQPLHYWKQGDCLIDGHTRRQAALNAGLFTVPVFEHSFETIDDALEYALSLQVERRNLTDAELVVTIQRLDKLKKRGLGNTEETGKSAEKLAQTLGTSRAKVEQIRAITKKADENVLESVKKGEMSINKAYNTVKKTQKQAVPQNTTEESFEPDFSSFNEIEMTDVTVVDENNDNVSDLYLHCVIETLHMLCFEDKQDVALLLFNTVYVKKYASADIISAAKGEQLDALIQLLAAA